QATAIRSGSCAAAISNRRPTVTTNSSQPNLPNTLTRLDNRLMLTTAALAGLDLNALDRYLQRAGVARSGPLHATAIAGGRSNLTFKVTDDDSAWVLRRPPAHGPTPSAHDVIREYRVVSALAGTDVPVPAAVAACPTNAVLGAPFQMTAFVEGPAGGPPPETA